MISGLGTRDWGLERVPAEGGRMDSGLGNGPWLEGPSATSRF
jgi:hypothetical protein